MTLLQRIRVLAAKAFRRNVRTHPRIAARAKKVIDDATPPPKRKKAPRPYALTKRDGHVIDQLTNYALFAVEADLGYLPGSLDVLQGSYNAGGVTASAGTHDGGGAVDLSPVNWEAKVHAARKVGFAAWHRTPIPGVWGEHIHCILIGNAKLSPAAAAQVVDYRDHRDGLADDGPDNTWHPDPIPTFHMPEYAV